MWVEVNHSISYFPSCFKGEVLQVDPDVLFVLKLANTQPDVDGARVTFREINFSCQRSRAWPVGHAGIKHGV